MTRARETGGAVACATLARMLADQPRRLPARVRRIVRDPDLAEEIAQEAVARAGRGLGRLRGGADEALLCSWLDTIARNLALNHVRDGSRRPQSLPLDATCDVTPRQGAAEDPGEALLLTEARRSLQDALDALPADLRDVVLARLVEERSTAETARRFGIGEGLVKWRLHRGRRLLREHLTGPSANPNLGVLTPKPPEPPGWRAAAVTPIRTTKGDRDSRG